MTDAGCPNQSAPPPSRVKLCAKLSVFFPVLPFFVFCWKTARKPPKKQGFCIPAEPENIWKRRENAQKNQGNPRKGKEQGIQKKQGKGGQGSHRFGSEILSVQFGSVAVWGWNGSSGSGFRFRRFLCKKVFFFCVSVQFNRKGQFRFRFRLETVPALPVPLSVSGRTVPMVLVSGSGSVPEPPRSVKFSVRKGRTWAIAARRGLYKSLFLLNSGRFLPRKRGKFSSELWLA